MLAPVHLGYFHNLVVDATVVEAQFYCRGVGGGCGNVVDELDKLEAATLSEEAATVSSARKAAAAVVLGVVPVVLIEADLRGVAFIGDRLAGFLKKLDKHQLLDRRFVVGICRDLFGADTLRGELSCSLKLKRFAARWAAVRAATFSDPGVVRGTLL